MARLESNIEYLNASPEDFSQGVQALLRAERECYDLLKQAKADVLAAVRQELPARPGREVKGTTYTRWGQWQVVVGDQVAPKAPTTSPRKSLADYRAEQAASGLAS